MGGYVFARVSRYTGIYLWTTSWHQFKSVCHQTSSFIPLATGDGVIKFWKVKVKGQGRWEGIYAVLNAILVGICIAFTIATSYVLLGTLIIRTLFNMFTLPPAEMREILWSACLFVCLSVYLPLAACVFHTSIRPNFTKFSLRVIKYLCLWLGPPLTTVRLVTYFRFMDDVMFWYNAGNRPESKTTRMFRPFRQMAAPSGVGQRC